MSSVEASDKLQNHCQSEDSARVAQDTHFSSLNFRQNFRNKPETLRGRAHRDESLSNAAFCLPHGEDAYLKYG